ncbi:hypothetical protein V6Z11_A02G165600 [Gossypium hirsutum]
MKMWDDHTEEMTPGDVEAEPRVSRLKLTLWFIPEYSSIL